jgi:hypothetical protein
MSATTVRTPVTMLGSLSLAHPTRTAVLDHLETNTGPVDRKLKGADEQRMH